MKVTSNTADLLIIEDKPLFLGIMLVLFILAFAGAGIAMISSGAWWGAIFLVFGGGMGVAAFAVFVRRVQVVFHRSEGYVEFRRRNVFGGHRVRLPLNEISRAEIEESMSSDSGSTYRVVLVAERGESAGRHPVTIAYSSGRGHQLAAEAINAWLETAHEVDTARA